MFANTKKQPLAIHSVAVANVALTLFKNLNIPESSLRKKTFENINALQESIFFAGLLHDLGKIDPNFQEFLTKKKVTDAEGTAVDGVHFLEKKENDKFSFLNYPRHNEISWALATHLLKSDKTAQYAIYYHHAKVLRPNKSKKDSSKQDWRPAQILELVFTNDTVVKSTTSFLNEIAKYTSALGDMRDKIVNMQKEITRLVIEDMDNIAVPGFLFDGVSKYDPEKRQEKDLIELKNLLVRSLVVSADRIVSSLNTNVLEQCINENEWTSITSDVSVCNNDLSTIIDTMLDTFEVNNQNIPGNRLRDNEQTKIAEKLANKQDVATLFGPAGCGKTKIFLEWYRNKAVLNTSKNKKLFIITPRKMICSSLFNELRTDYIPTAKIELLTGDDKLFWDGSTVSVINESVGGEADVTITTVDQMISIMLSHKKIDLLLDFLTAHVVFDEYHEFFNIPGIVILFKFFIRLKTMMTQSNTLLVSATPNYYFLENVLGLKNSVEYIDTFNKELFKFTISKYEVDNETKNQLQRSVLFESQAPGTIVIFNTAKASQSSTMAVNGENVINFHSKFTPEDKNTIYQQIVKNWKAKNPVSDKVLRSGPIVQASLNISTMHLLTQACSAENWCQRIGRANRFGSNIGTAEVVTVVSDKTLTGDAVNNSELKFLDRIAAKEQTIEWLTFLIENNFKNSLNCEMRLSDLYEQYKEFHSLEKVKTAYANDFEKIVISSLAIFAKNDFTPTEFWKAYKSVNTNKLSSKSIRGSSIYVLPVTYDVYTGLGDWLYIPDENQDSKKLLTLSELELNGKDAVFNNQIQVLRAQRINKFTTATYASMVQYKSMNAPKIKLEAKNATSPLLLSYTKDVGNYKALNQCGLFYVSKGDIKIGLYELSIK